MARKKSGLEVMIELAALLPPWAALVLAMVSYAVLHEMSLIDIPSARDAREEALLVTATLKKQGATIGQYLIPACLVIGAIVSFVRHRSRKTLAAETKARGNMSALLDMSWQDFERLVSEAYRQQGYQVMERGGAGPDGGVDLELKRGSETFLVQCKQWRAQKVGVDVVRELYGVWRLAILSVRLLKLQRRRPVLPAELRWCNVKHARGRTLGKHSGVAPHILPAEESGNSQERCADTCIYSKCIFNHAKKKGSMP